MTKKTDIEKINSFLESLGYCLLSTDYKNNRTKLEVSCNKDGNEWITTWKRLLNGHRCSQCRELNYNDKYSPNKYNEEFRKKQLETIKSIAIERGGKCLSDTYNNNRDLLEFCCNSGHTWKTTYKNVVGKDSWCPICLEESYIKIEDIKLIAIKHGGYCLSDNIVNRRVKLKCCLNHEWEASVTNIAKGSWCPICSSSISEEICRYCIEYLTGYKFPKSNPNWLKNRQNRQLHLDGFCEELKIAFEHQGEQHFKKIDCFKYDLKRTQENDEDKALRCSENNVSLFYIMSLGYRTKTDDLPSLIEDFMIKNNVNLLHCASDIIMKNVFYEIYKNKKNTFHNYMLEKAEKKAKRYGGCFLGMYNDKFRFKCNVCNNIWETEKVYEKTWCPNCSIIKRRNTIEDARNLATSKGGICLSTEYKNNNTKMLWKCELGHIWESTYNCIQNCWCPHCNKNLKLSLNDAIHAATEKNGLCLSLEYKNSSSSMLWQCQNGHKWKACLNNIKNGHWCPICNGNKKQFEIK